jgi:hypothetical protein
MAMVVCFHAASEGAGSSPFKEAPNSQILSYPFFLIHSLLIDLQRDATVGMPQ